MKAMFRLQNISTAMRWSVIAGAAVLAACTPAKRSNPQVEIRGSTPTASQPAPQPQPQPQPQPSGPSAPDASGIVNYDGYQTAVARNGDTVADVAARVGMSASELGSYNGLQPTHVLRPGDELVLPQRPGGYGAGAVAQAPTATQTPTQPGPSVTAPPTPTQSIEAQPLDGITVADDGTVPQPTAQDVTVADVATGGVDVTPTASPQPPQQPSDWSPDLAIAAIERSETGIKDDGSLGAPPSSEQPVPPEPTARGELKSPDLSQYQTPEEPTGQDTTPEPQETVVAAADPTPQAQPKNDLGGLRLRRPVKGPVAIGFNKGAGPQRNDGVDFAAAAGSPVVAAADGEVALVSQSLGGLGTIVLVRHPNEILTVYGRVDGVSVKKGDIIQSGQKIGVVSNATAPAEPRMHFEVRRGAESLDPMQFL